MSKPAWLADLPATLSHTPATLAVAAAVVLWASPSVAQQSSSYTLKESVINAGGHPANGAVLSSASYRVRLDSIGEVAVRSALASASYRADGGFVPRYPPPGQVTGFAFADRTTLRWDPEKSIGGYNLYRDLLPALRSGGYGMCLQRDLPSETATDADTPPIGGAWFYLVTARNRLDEEGSKGTNSAGAERPNTAPCP